MFWLLRWAQWEDILFFFLSPSIMNESKRYHTATEKHHILTQYRRHTYGAGFRAWAKRFSIPGGAATLSRWYATWDGTVTSLQHLPRSGRPTTFTPAEVSAYISTPIRKKNRKPEAVHYTELQPALQEQTGKSVCLRTIQRYGQKTLKATQKRTMKRTRQESKCMHIIKGGVNNAVSCLWYINIYVCCLCVILLVSSSLCESIAKERRRAQRICKSKILFLDETALRLSEAPPLHIP